MRPRRPNRFRLGVFVLVLLPLLAVPTPAQSGTSGEGALDLLVPTGARAIGMADKIGSLDAGKLADLIVVRMDQPHQTPLYNVVSQLVYATKASDVETVIINGQIVMENRKVLTIDESAVMAKAREFGKRIRGKAEGKGQKAKGENP